MYSQEYVDSVVKDRDLRETELRRSITLMDAQNKYFRKLIGDVRSLLREYADPEKWDGNTVQIDRNHAERFNKTLDELEIKDGTIKLDLLPQTLAEARTMGRAEAFKLLVEMTLDQFAGSEFMDAGQKRVRFDEQALRNVLQPEAKHMSLISGLEDAYWMHQAQIHDLTATIRSCQDDARRIDTLADNRIIEGFVGLTADLDEFAAEELPVRNNPDEAVQAYRTAFRNMVDGFIEILEVERGYIHMPRPAD